MAASRRRRVTPRRSSSTTQTREEIDKVGRQGRFEGEEPVIDRMKKRQAIGMQGLARKCNSWKRLVFRHVSTLTDE